MKFDNNEKNDIEEEVMTYDDFCNYFLIFDIEEKSRLWGYLVKKYSLDNIGYVYIVGGIIGSIVIGGLLNTYRTYVVFASFTCFIYLYVILCEFLKISLRDYLKSSGLFFWTVFFFGFIGLVTVDMFYKSIIEEKSVRIAIGILCGVGIACLFRYYIAKILIKAPKLSAWVVFVSICFISFLNIHEEFIDLFQRYIDK